MSDQPRNRRIDRIVDAEFLQGLQELSLHDLRVRRDECLAEREYLSLLRRLLQGRAEILRAEVESRAATEDRGPLIDRLATILSDEDHPASSRGEMVRIALPEEELLMARRRVERLANRVDLSDPARLEDSTLAEVVETLGSEEEGISRSRRDVIAVLDTVQDELKRRYRDDPSLALK